MKYYLSLLALIFSCNSYAQITMVDTPYCYHHVLHAEVTAGIIPTTSGITTDDGWSGVIPIGFTYNFYGTPNTQCIIGSNGMIGFTLASAGAYNTWPIGAPLATSTATDVRNVVCGPWCDVYIPAGGTIEYSMQGVAPFRNFAVTWCGTRMYSCTTEWLTTQIIIYETTGLAEVHIGHRTICLTGWNGQKAIVGVKNAAGTVSTVAPGRDFPAIWATTNEGWQFTPAAGPTYTVTSIPYAPIPYASSMIYWYDSTTGAYLGSGPNLTVVPTVPTTYKAGALSCNDTLWGYIHVLPPTCLTAIASDPCIGDTLKLGGMGDSTGAVYMWSGPGGFTSTAQYPFRYPTTWADTGMYIVYKNVGGTLDTDQVHVIFHPLPVVVATSNIPNSCDPFINPFTLLVNLDSIGETFSWAGPWGFTSTMQNPTIPGFDSSRAGLYTVTGTTMWGCSASATTDVFPGIVPGFEYKIHYGCNYDTVYFTNTTYNANSYDWYFDDPTSGAEHTRHTMHIYKASNKIFAVRLYVKNARCDTSITINIDLRHEINADFDPQPDTICFGGGPVVFVNNSNAVDSMFSGLPPTTSTWSFGDGGTDLTSAPSYTYNTPGRYPVKLVVSDAMGCQDSTAKFVYVLQMKIKSFHDTTLCLSQALPLTNEVVLIPEIDVDYKFSWTESSPNLDDLNIQMPELTGYGEFFDTLTVTIPGVFPDGCPTTNIVRVNSIEGRKLHQLTVSQSIDYGESIQLNASNHVFYYWLPNDGTLNNNNISNPVASPKQTTTYTVYGHDIYGCRDSANITIYVDTSMTQDIPTGFTPNGDGLNDVFRPVGIKFQNMVEFRVFNRWGQELFFTNNKETGWDGTYHGMKQDLGVYNYLIIVAKPGGDNVVYKGNVTLIR